MAVYARLAGASAWSSAGQLTIVGAATGRVRLTGQLDWRGHAPAGTNRLVNDQVTSGYVHVGIPVTGGTEHTVTARVLSGELDLLAS